MKPIGHSDKDFLYWRPSMWEGFVGVGKKSKKFIKKLINKSRRRELKNRFIKECE